MLINLPHMTLVAMPKRLPTTYVILILSIVLSSPLAAQQLRPGEWRSFLTQADNEQLIATNDGFLLCSDVGISFYNSDLQLGFSLDPLGPLNGQRTQLMAYDTLTGRHFLAYSDGRIDYFTQPDAVEEILDLFITTNFSDKRINQLYPSGDTLLIATNFGLLLYEIDRQETRGTFTQIGALTEPTVSNVAMTTDSIFVLVNDGVYSAPRVGANLADGANWQRSLSVQNNGGLRALHQTRDGLYLVNDASLRYRDAQANWSVLGGASAPDTAIIHMGSNANFAWCISNDTLYRILGNSIQADTTAEGMTRASFSNSGQRWAYVRWGATVLVNLSNGWERLPLTELFPPTNRGRHVRVQDGKLYITANFRSGVEPSYNQVGVSEYNLSQPNVPESWRQFNGGSKGIPDFFYSPTLPFLDSRRNLWIGSFDHGVVRIAPEGEVVHYSDENTPLVGIFPDDEGGWIATRITDVIEDQQGVLWMTLYAADQNRSLVAHNPETNQWHLFQLPEGWTYELLQDQNGYIWIRNWRNGVTVFDYNGTPFDASDDRARLLSTGDLAGGLSNSVVQDLVMDREGYIWSATAAGVVVFYNTFNIFELSTSTDATCPVFERRCLLENFQVNAIAVDGANNKYFGTEGGGVYYFSADGSQELAHYTTANSPLVSDIVTDLAINPETGELFIATDAGVVSYQADATAPVEVQPESDQKLELYAFPNPYKPAEHTQLTVRGSSFEGEVKVTTASGMLVKELTSLGGSVVWDGRDVQGKVVSSGIYLIHVLDPNGEVSGITKVAVESRR